MVDPDTVEQLAHEADPVLPERKAVLLHLFPIVKWIPPKLSVLGKTVGQNAGHPCGPKTLIQLKILRILPHIGAV